MIQCIQFRPCNSEPKNAVVKKKELGTERKAVDIINPMVLLESKLSIVNILWYKKDIISVKY